MSPESNSVAEPAPAPAATAAGNAKLLLVLAGIAVVMVAFAFVVLPPLYSLICREGGSSMNPNNPTVANAPAVATGRFVEVFFESKIFDQLPLRFVPEHERQRVEVGTDTGNLYRLQNLSDRVVRFRPIHQVDPGIIQEHFGMKVCFCFNDQEIGPGEERELPVVYRFDPAMDARVQDVTICYSLLALVEGEDEAGSLKRLEQAGGSKGAVVSPRFKATPPPTPPAPAP